MTTKTDITPLSLTSTWLTPDELARLVLYKEAYHAHYRDLVHEGCAPWYAISLLRGVGYAPPRV